MTIALPAASRVKNYKGPALAPINITGGAQAVVIQLDLADYFTLAEGNAGGIAFNLVGQQTAPLLPGGIQSFILDTTFRGGPAGGTLEAQIVCNDTQMSVIANDNQLVHSPVITGSPQFIVYFFASPSLNQWGGAALLAPWYPVIVTNRYMAPIVFQN